MSNMREIAKRAGVGIATVSRYINNTGYVSEEVRAKIQKEIDKSGYVPNALARAIFTNSSKTIGLMIPNITNPFFNQLATVIEDRLNEYGYTIFLCHTEDNKDREKEYLEVLKSHRVDGIIASRAQLKEEYLNTKIPVVSFESEIDQSILTISSDNYKGGKLAFSHLYQRGCRNILHIKGPKIFEATELRYKGFLDKAGEKNIGIDIVEFETDFNTKKLEENLKRIKNIDKYDGIFVFNDIAAATVMKYLKKKDIHIPRDIQIIGYDNSFICELLYPELTTIDQNINEIGDLTVKLVLELIDGKEIEIKNHIIDISLIQRETTRD